MGCVVKANIADDPPTVPLFRVAAELTSPACRVDAVKEGGGRRRHRRRRGRERGHLLQDINLFYTIQCARCGISAPRKSLGESGLVVEGVRTILQRLYNHRL